MTRNQLLFIRKTLIISPLEDCLKLAAMLCNNHDNNYKNVINANDKNNNDHNNNNSNNKNNNL